MLQYQKQQTQIKINSEFSQRRRDDNDDCLQKILIQASCYCFCCSFKRERTRLPKVFSGRGQILACWPNGTEVVADGGSLVQKIRLMLQQNKFTKFGVFSSIRGISLIYKNNSIYSSSSDICIKTMPSHNKQAQAQSIFQMELRQFISEAMAVCEHVIQVMEDHLPCNKLVWKYKKNVGRPSQNREFSSPMKLSKSVVSVVQRFYAKPSQQQSDNSTKAGIQDAAEVSKWLASNSIEDAVQILKQYASNISEASNISSSDKPALTISGSICQVQKRRVKFKESNMQTEQTMAIKKFRPPKEQNFVQNDYIRFKREIDIVRHLIQQNKQKHVSYLLHYYVVPGTDKMFMMDWVEHNLCFFLNYYRQFLTLEDIVDMCIQIVEIVVDLQAKGVVHRDLKPSNFMVDLSGPRLRIKLIDFSDAVIMGKDLTPLLKNNMRLFSTVFYSPPEASVLSKNYIAQGLFAPEIDRWSVGVLIYELVHGHLPISYSSIFCSEIHALWQTEFLQLLCCRRAGGRKHAVRVMDLLAWALVRIDPKERMDLHSVLTVLRITQTYIQCI